MLFSYFYNRNEKLTLVKYNKILTHLAVAYTCYQKLLCFASYNSKGT